MKKTLLLLFCIIIPIAHAEWVDLGLGIWYDYEKEIFCNELQEQCPPIRSEPQLIREEIADGWHYEDDIVVTDYISKYYWLYETNEFYIKVPEHATCIWSQKKDRDCYYDVELEYKSDTPKLLTEIQPRIDFSKEEFKDTNLDFKIKEEPKTELIKGVYNFRYEFEFPPNKHDKVNISLFGLTIDPDVTECSVINESGEYYLTNQILGETTTKCFTFDEVTDVLFHCQGNLIDGNNVADYVFYADYNSEIDAGNITIKDCPTSDWDNYAYYIVDVGNIVLDNITTDPADRMGYFWDSDYLTVKNSYIRAADYIDDGIYIYSCGYPNISDTHFQTADNALYFSSIIGTVYLHNVSISDVDNLPVYFNNEPTTVEYSNLTARCSDTDNYRNIHIVTDENGGTVENMDDLVQLIIIDSDNFHVNNVTIHGSPDQWCGSLSWVDSDYINITNSYLYNVIGLQPEDQPYGFDISGNTIINASNYMIITGTDISATGAKKVYNNTLKYSSGSIGLMYVVANMDNVEIYNNYFENDDSIILINADGVLIYNNVFNVTDSTTTNYLGVSEPTNLMLNTSNQLGDRILGGGNNISGNAWLNQSGTGYYHTCTDINQDGFCDSAFYVLGSFADMMPLSDEYSDGGEPPGNTCDCDSIQSGNPIDCTECDEITACDALGQELVFEGQDFVRITGDITNHGLVTRKDGCTIICVGGCF